MTNMDWQQLENKIYFRDGSLRDIYVLDTSREDWKTWVNFVNENYKTSFHIFENDVTEDKIPINKILEYWNGDIENCSTATIYINDVIIKSHFFIESEIENDILPREIKSIENHNNLMKYMTGLSKALNKKVILTPENMPEYVLVSADNDEITINLEN